MIAQVVLTVAESKRLIARGIAADARVKAALKQGIVAVAKGTTNAYVVEELLGKEIDKSRYVTGCVIPAKRKGAGLDASLPDVVLRDGKPLEGATVKAIVREMRQGDVFIKGANALNYERRQAATLIGDATGGTLGATLGTIIGKKVTLLTPVGLEKNVPGDLAALARLIAEERRTKPPVFALWLTPGEIFTEIEALKVLADVEALPCAAGGVADAEGSIRLLLRADHPKMNKALRVLRTIQGEPPFLPD
ncbi:MAG: hypothetical protein V2A58_01755 [Planctomycetota bacterium]